MAFANAALQGERKARAKFLHFFPSGFYDRKYIDWERGYKWAAHRRWEHSLNQQEYRTLLRGGQFREIAERALAIEGPTNLLFSFEKMALRDAVRGEGVAKAFNTGLYDFLYGEGGAESKFENWRGLIDSLPRKQSRMLTWPIVTIFGFVAMPKLTNSISIITRGRHGALTRAFFRTDGGAGFGRSASTRYDRHTIVPLGARFGRIC
jgi:hypothetical protein